jgi:hypothetical protein
MRCLLWILGLAALISLALSSPAVPGSITLDDEGNIQMTPLRAGATCFCNGVDLLYGVTTIPAINASIDSIATEFDQRARSQNALIANVTAAQARAKALLATVSARVKERSSVRGRADASYDFISTQAIQETQSSDITQVISVLERAVDAGNSSRRALDSAVGNMLGCNAYGMVYSTLSKKCVRLSRSGELRS